jgi:phosphatidylserine decarboxylase
MRFASEGAPFVLPFVLAAALLLASGRPAWAAAAGAAALAVLAFFRDPARRYDGPPDVVLAPGAGVITAIEEFEEAEEIPAIPEIGETPAAPEIPGKAGAAARSALAPGRYTRVVTFLSVFDVHVQKAPAAGEVIASRHAAGRKLAAFRPEAGRVNEQHLSVIRRANGDLVGVSQIAGLLARRVVCYLRAGDRVDRGQPMGLIKFGSRVDLIVPATYELLVRRGDRVRNGLTPIAAPPAHVAADAGAAP